MKIKVSAVALMAFFVLVASASAFHWHLGYGQAKHATKEFAEAFCKADPECDGWGVGTCHRRSESRVDCLMAAFFEEEPEPGKEVECDIMLHWGVDREGYIALKNHGPAHCHTT